MQLPLEYRFTCRVSPVQAEGTVAGRPFYFRARWDHWSFAVAERAGVDPVDIQIAERATEQGGWLREGTVGNPREYLASYLSEQEASALIERCAAEYLAEREKARGNAGASD